MTPTSLRTPPGTHLFYGWKIAAACFTNLFVIVGIVYYSFPVFYAPLIQEFGWSRAEVTAGFFLSMVLVGPVFGISAGFLIDRHGSRRILLAGLVSAGIAFLGFSWMHSLKMYYLFYFFQTVGYVSAGPIPHQVLISHWFARMRGRAMGLAYVGIGIGGAVAPVLAQFLIGHFGWRTTMLFIGGGILLVLIPLTLLLVKDHPAKMGLFADGESIPLVPTERVEPAPTELAVLLKVPAFWLILTGSLMSIGAVGGVIQHLQLYLRDQHFTPEKAALVASYLLISSIAGRLVMGFLADRFPRKYVMLAACLMVACAIPALYAVALPGIVYVFAVVFGFGMGADYMLIPLITAECFGTASLGKLMGIILTTDALAQAFAPVVVSRIYDLQKSYDWGFIVLMAMASAGALAVSRIPLKARTKVSSPPTAGPPV
jgi:MFS family permease